jgi:hypothetical protein
VCGVPGQNGIKQAQISASLPSFPQTDGQASQSTHYDFEIITVGTTLNCLDRSDSGQEQAVGACECCKEPHGFRKFEKLPD